MTLACHPPFGLPPRSSPEMTRAVPAYPRAALMPLIIDDSFYDGIGGSLPDCSVAFLNRAGSWSARNSESGFVPSWALARFSSDLDQAVKPLLSAHLVKRVTGGIQILQGNGITIVNATDAAREAAEAEAEAAAKRSAKSSGGKHGNHKRWHEDRGMRVPGCGFCEASGAAPDTPEKRTSHSDRIRVASESDATPVDRSKSDLSSPVTQKQNRKRPAARAGDSDPAPGTQAFRLQVTAKFAAVAKIDISPETADAIASDVLAGKKHVDRRLLYVLTAIGNEKDPVGRWLPGYVRPAPLKAAVPDWCGKCDETDRSIWDEQADSLRWCPDCSPKTRPGWAA